MFTGKAGEEIGGGAAEEAEGGRVVQEASRTFGLPTSAGLAQRTEGSAGEQGDEVGLYLAHWTIVYFGKFLSYRNSQK
jgi:hypothetical protein